MTQHTLHKWLSYSMSDQEDMDTDYRKPADPYSGWGTPIMSALGVACVFAFILAVVSKGAL